VIDHDFTDASKSPFEYERGKSPKFHPEYNMERQWGRETVYVFHARPGSMNRALHDWQARPSLDNFACRLIARLKGDNRTAMLLWLGKLPQGYCLGVKVWDDGELTVGEVPWKKSALSFPDQKRIYDKTIRPGEQTHELLIFVQERQLRAFVNGKEVGEAIGLPEALLPATPGIGAWHIGGGEARVQFLRYELWDLDKPQ
jgi:hypothetical protein